MSDAKPAGSVPPLPTGRKKKVPPPSGLALLRATAIFMPAVARSASRFHGSASSYFEAKNRCSTGWSAGCSSPLALCSNHHWMRRRNRCGVQVRITVWVGSK